MEIDKRRSKGSFLNLFDWNGVSRKKLFYANPNLPEDLKQTKENVENMPKSQLNRTKVDENGINPSNITSCDFNCEPSVTSDAGCKGKAPGLVARLMGLDSLPTSTVNELSSTALHASKSLGSSHCHEGDVDSKESRAHKAQNRTIEARPQKNAANILEAKPTPYIKSKMSSAAACSSIPLRIRDLKQKSEAARYAPTHEKIVHTNTIKGSRGLEKISPRHYGSKGKSNLLAIQAKANAQSRDTLTSNDSRGNKQKEHNEIASNQFFRTQKPNLQQAMMQRTCPSRNSHAKEHGQNKQMQNSVTHKGRSTSMVDSKKPTTRSFTGGARKTTNKGSVIANFRPKSSRRRATDVKKEYPLSKTKSNSIEKRYTKRYVLPDNAVNNNYESKSIKCNRTTDGSTNQDALNKKASKGIISFTFTSPLRKESQSSTHKNNVDVNAPGLHMIDGDALNVPLERKVQELTSRINSPECTLATGVSSAVLQSSEVSIESGEGDRCFHSDPHGGKLHSMHNYACSSSDDLMLDMNQQLQGSKAMTQYSRDSNIETEYDQGGGVYFCIQHEVSKEQSSCTLAEDVAAEQVCGVSNLVDYNRSSNLELEYVQDILSNAELMEENFALGQTITNKVIKTNVFDMLEKWSSGTESHGEEHSKLERNLLFDCVSECLQFRRNSQTFIGSYKGWAVQSKIWWAEDLYSEILGFKSMQEVMVDQLVYMDMSSQHGTWLHFQTELFEEVLEIEWDISTSLINDLVSDLLHH